MKSRRPRLTYANVVATIALFASLVGVSYAATTLPKNSVGADQVRAEAIRTGKIADDAVTGAKLAQGVRERLAPVGATPTTTSTPESVKHAETADSATTASKATSATHADSADTANLANRTKDAEALGGQPADHYMTADSVLQSGQAEAGDFIAAAGNGEAGTVLVQFWPHLPESLREGHIKVIAEGAPGTSECPGPGQAAPSYMCVYESFNEGMSFESFISTMPGSIYAGPLSGVMTWRATSSTGYYEAPGPTPPRSPGRIARQNLRVLPVTNHHGTAIPLQRFVLTEEIIVPVEAALDLAPQAGNQDYAYRPLSVPRMDVPKKSA